MPLIGRDPALMSARVIRPRHGRGRRDDRLGQVALGRSPAVGPWPQWLPRRPPRRPWNRGPDLKVEVHHRALFPVDGRPDGGPVAGRLLEHEIDGSLGSGEDGRSWFLVSDGPTEQLGVEVCQSGGAAPRSRLPTTCRWFEIACSQLRTASPISVYGRSLMHLGATARSLRSAGHRVRPNPRLIFTRRPLLPSRVADRRRQ